MMGDLDKLIAAVEAGETVLPGGWTEELYDILDPADFVAIMEGSLDAALRLHEALLPEWEFWIKQSHAEFSCAVAWDGIWHAMIRAEADNPARAWLLAILRAVGAKTPSTPADTPDRSPRPAGPSA